MVAAAAAVSSAVSCSQGFVLKGGAAEVRAIGFHMRTHVRIRDVPAEEEKQLLLQGCRGRPRSRATLATYSLALEQFERLSSRERELVCVERERERDSEREKGRE